MPTRNTFSSYIGGKRPKGKLDVDSTMSDLNRAVRMFGAPVRRFREFPGDKWGRKAIWYTSLVDGKRISRAEAQRRFYQGKPVAYVARSGRTMYAAWVVYDPRKGVLPSRAKGLKMSALAEITKADVQRVREALRKAGISAFVRKGSGSMRFTLRVKPRGKVSPRRIIQLLRPLGYMPEDLWQVAWRQSRALYFYRMTLS